MPGRNFDSLNELPLDVIDVITSFLNRADHRNLLTVSPHFRDAIIHHFNTDHYSSDQIQLLMHHYNFAKKYPGKFVEWYRCYREPIPAIDNPRLDIYKQAQNRYGTRGSAESHSESTRNQIIWSQFSIMHRVYLKLSAAIDAGVSPLPDVATLLDDSIEELLLPVIHSIDKLPQVLTDFIKDREKLELYRDLCRCDLYFTKIESSFSQPGTDPLAIDNPQLIFKLLLYIMSTTDINCLNDNIGLFEAAIEMFRQILKPQPTSEADPHSFFSHLLLSLELTLLAAKGEKQEFNKKRHQLNNPNPDSENFMAVSVNLAKGNLQGDSFMWANWEMAYLREVKLDNTNMHKANLGRADMRKAKLRNVNLQGANICGADMRGADLWDTVFCGASNFEPEDPTTWTSMDCDTKLEGVIVSSYTLISLIFAALFKNSLVPCALMEKLLPHSNDLEFKKVLDSFSKRKEDYFSFRTKSRRGFGLFDHFNSKKRVFDHISEKLEMESERREKSNTISYQISS